MTYRTVPLGELITIDRDTLQPGDIQSGTVYVGLEHITADGCFVGAGAVQNGELASAKFRFGPSHVLYGKLRPYLRKIACPAFSGICSTDILPLLPGPDIDRRYLYHFLRTPEIVSLAAARSSGINLPRLSPNTLLEFNVRLPSLPEQQRIAAVLDKAEALRQRRDAASLRLQDLFRSIFLQLFTSSGAVEWPDRKVEELARPERNSIRTGPFGSQLLHGEFVDKGIAVLGIDNAVQNEFAWANKRFIRPEKFQQLKRYTVYPGDVIITIMGTCGRCAIVPDDIPLAINTKHLCCITFDQSKCLPSFLHAAFLHHPQVRRQLQEATRGAIMEGLNMGIIKSLQIPVPPLDRQKRFAAFTAMLRCRTRLYRTASKRTDALFESLRHRAFTPSVGSAS